MRVRKIKSNILCQITSRQLGFTNIAYVELTPCDVDNNVMGHLILKNRFRKQIWNFYPICLLCFHDGLWDHGISCLQPYKEMLITTPNPFDLRDGWIRDDLLIKMSKICYERDLLDKEWDQEYERTFITHTRNLDVQEDAYYACEHLW